MILKIFLTILFITSCAKVGTLNLEGHRYGETPHKIIWLQIAGLDLDHVAMLRFWNRNAMHKTSLENLVCAGSMWNYNLYKLRPKAALSFMSQISGTKNVSGSCDDFNTKPVWHFLGLKGFKTGIFEIGANNGESLDQSIKCKKADPSYNLPTIWKMRAAPHKSVNFFHYQEDMRFKDGEVYYDRSCKNNICFANFYDNINRIYPIVAKQYPKYLFIVRDFSYLKALKSKNLSNIKEILMDIEKLVASFNKIAEKTGDTLVLITSAETSPLEFPAQGNKWLKFERTGQNILYKRPALTSMALARGPGAENFCGVYQESEVLKRMMFNPKLKSLFSSIMGTISK